MPDVTHTWVKSSFCADGTCVEVAAEGDVILIRDSKRIDREPLRFTRREWYRLLEAIRAGDIIH